MRLSRFGAGLTLLWALGAGCASPPSTSGPQSRSASSAAPSVGDPLDALPELPADAREKVLAEMTAVLLTEKHLMRRAIDDTLSKQSFPNYLSQLDGAKLLLLQEHVAALSKYSDRMDDELRERDLVLARKGAALVVERRKLAAKLVAEILAKPFDFGISEEAETDPEKLAFAQSEAELRDRWRRMLKLQALERIQQMEEIAARKDQPKQAQPGGASVDDDDDESAVRELDPLSIPATFEGREAKARRDIATRYQTRFARLASLDPLEPASMFLNAIASAVDPHTQYLAPADKANFDIAISGTLEGIGAVLGEQDHYIVVRELVPGGASWKQGRLEPGDLIIAVSQAGKPAVDVTDMPIDKVVQMIRGPKGSVVTLTVKKPDGKIENIAITRDVIEVEATYARGATLDLGPKHEPMGYVHLPGFYGDIGNGNPRSGERNATDDVRALLTGFEKKKLQGVILDLRGNGGGLLSHARDISGLFLARGPVVQTRDSSGAIGILADTDPGVVFSGQVVVMVDRFSASAAEILAAALQDYERAVIVGTGPTHGKGTVQAVVELDRLLETPGRDPLGVFKLTIEQYFRVTGGSVQWKGVTPDILLPDPAAYVKSGERTLPHSIPWTSVGSLPYARHPHRWTIAELAAQSRDRLHNHALFEKIDAFSQLLKARREDSRALLERDRWIAKRTRDKELLEAADPKLKQLSPLLELRELPSSAPPPPPDKRLRRKLDAWKDELVRDPWVAESLEVLTDMTRKK
jgi:carboxyl-terminal processing protease